MFHASDRISILKDRALMLKKARLFFSRKNILEVDCPHLSKRATIDTHIDVMKTHVNEQEIGYLHTSPEYGMKRLLGEGMPDIFQLSHVFRKGEIGRLHNPEFTLIEWYRKGFPLSKMIQETISLIRLFFGKTPTQQQTYQQLFLEKTSLDPFKASLQALLSHLQENQILLPKDASSFDKDTLLHLILTHLIEPNLGKDHLFVVTDFPASQAALAQIEESPNGNVAKRFEVYYQGIELANGYLELSDPKELRKRFLFWNEERKKLNKELFATDERLLDALSRMPACSGVAVGFDRLLMLRHRKKHLSEVLPFAWEEA
jgi:lysyl-tRNA synthetase class 2